MRERVEFTTNVLLISTCLMLSVVLGLRLWRGDLKSQGTSPSVENVENLELTIALSNGPVEGEQGATLVLVEFSDFECPFCAKHVRETYPQLREEYIISGKLRHVFRNLPLTSIHQFAFSAAKAAECALRQDRFWQMKAQLFQSQHALMDTELQRHARAVGLDESSFATCLDDPATSARIEADVTEAARLGVASTPTFFIGVIQRDGTAKLVRRISGALPFSVFATALDEVADSVSVAKRETSPARSLLGLFRAVPIEAASGSPQGCSSAASCSLKPLLGS